MKSLKLAVVLSLGLLASQALATVVDFRTLAVGTQVTNQYGDFTASLSGGNASGAPEIAYYTGGSWGVRGGLSNSPDQGNYPTAEFLNIAFTAVVTNLSFLFDNEGYNGGNAWYAYDSSNTLIDSGALTDMNTTWINVTGNVASISFGNGYSTGNANNWTQALGAISYDVVPDSGSTLALLGAALLGGAALRRKLKVA